ncbi:MAG: M48 family metallopeptidase [Bradyrhizobiaceae bacterium]|nr:M48 family metallopeptidase [Bradyrhizobiaceae bacterium]
MAAYGLYNHIRANRVRSIFLIVGLFFLVYLLSFAGALFAAVMTEGDAPLDYLFGVARGYFIGAIPFVTVGTLIWLWIAWQFHQRMIDAVVNGHDVTRQEEPRLYNLLENLCISRGIPTPKLKIVEDSALNAFATGMNEKQYAISVTRGLMDRLDDKELEAVLGHELTHIRNGDVRMMVIAVVIAGVISFVGELIYRGIFRSGVRGGGWSGGRSSGSRGKGGGGAAIAILIALAIVAIAWLLSIVIRFSLSRTREYLADAGAVELTKNPDAMIMALRKIENRGEIAGATAFVMEMCVDNPHSGFVDIFSTHPSIERRVEALVRTAGGRDPGPIAVPAYEDEPLGEIGPEEPEELEEVEEVRPAPAPEYEQPLPRGPWDYPRGNPFDPWQWGPWGPRR